jgi:hypothetical protein
MASDIVIETRFGDLVSKTTAPNPPRPPVIVIRPGRRRHVIIKGRGASVELIWPLRPQGLLEVVTRGRSIWVNNEAVTKTTAPNPPRPPFHLIVRSPPFTVEIGIGNDGKTLIVEVRPRRVRVNGNEWLKGKTTAPTPPRPPVKPTRRATLARSSTAPTTHRPPT